MALRKRSSNRGTAGLRVVAGAVLVVAAAAGTAGEATAAEVRLAVASNFAATAGELAARFEAESGHRVVLVSGSTGKLYAQIVHGARLDAFLAADRRRPERLERDGLAVPGSRFTYARGHLVLWSPRPGYVDAAGRVLETGGFRRLAIANPRLAPYGEAARRVLESRGLWNELGSRLVRGENVAQAYQYVVTGNAELGLVAYSQIVARGGRSEGSFWLVPQALHPPIDQQAVLLRDVAAARGFLAFLAGEAGRAIVESHGYALP